MDPNLENQIGECVGLWLAEGGVKSNSEITFTNNCFPLVDLFKKTINKLFIPSKYKQRIYIYSKDGERVNIPYTDCVIKYYVHKRATKPYFIFRIASVSILKEWKKIVNEMLNKNDKYQFILRGFFAGEGNIHEGKRSVRVIRISQKEEKYFINKLLNYFNLKYTFTPSNRNYVISNKSNWDIFAKYLLADLHPKKKEKFWRLYNSFKEEHYVKNYLKNKIPELINEPKTSKELAKILNRSQARISEVLISLKKEEMVNNYRVRSIDYWTTNKELVIISKVKAKYLHLLDKEKTTMELSKELNVHWKSSFKRLGELNKLKLVKLNANKKWEKTETKKRIWVI